MTKRYLFVTFALSKR